MRAHSDPDAHVYTMHRHANAWAQAPLCGTRLVALQSQEGAPSGPQVPAMCAAFQPQQGSFPMRFWGEGSLQLPLVFPPPPLLKHRLGRHCLPYTLTVHLLLRGTRQASWNLRGGFPSPSHLCCWALGRGQAGLAQTGGRCVDLPGGRGGRASAAVIGALCKRSSPGTFRSSVWAARAR